MTQSLGLSSKDHHHSIASVYFTDVFKIQALAVIQPGPHYDPITIIIIITLFYVTVDSVAVWSLSMVLFSSTQAPRWKSYMRAIKIPWRVYFLMRKNACARSIPDLLQTKL